MSDVSRAIVGLALVIAITATGYRIDEAIRYHAKMMLCIEAAKVGVGDKCQP